MLKDEGRYYTIGEVAEFLGLEPHVIRYWEKEFPQLKPLRIAGRRFYRSDQIEILKRIKRLLYEEGYTIAGARKALSRSSKPANPEELLKEVQRELRLLYEMLS